MDEADLTARSPEELSALRDRAAEALASGDPAPVKTPLQALIHEIRVDSRNAIQPTFRVPVGGDHQQNDAVRGPSRSVEVMGLEPTTSTLQRSHSSQLSYTPEGHLDLVGEGPTGVRFVNPTTHPQR